MNTIVACAGETVTPGVVQFDPAAFIVAYPAFATIDADILQSNFNLATLQLDNSCCSVVPDAPTRSQLLNLLTAHITALLNGVNGVAPSGIVGRIDKATQGSVSVSAAFDAAGFSDSYFAQTPWGAMFWQLTVSLRTGTYIPPCDDYYDFGGCNSWNAWPQ